jgi:hypothetical protein
MLVHGIPPLTVEHLLVKSKKRIGKEQKVEYTSVSDLDPMPDMKELTAESKYLDSQ